MKKILFSCGILLIVGSVTSFSEEKKLANDQEMIQEAIRVLQKNSSADWETFQPGQYDQTHVIREKNQTTVSFAKQLTYVPYQSAFAHGVSLEFKNPYVISFDLISNPKDFSENPPTKIKFFKPNSIQKKEIEKLKYIIRAEYPDLHANGRNLSKEVTVAIQEESAIYQVQIKTPSVLIRLNLDKSSGEVLERSSKQYRIGQAG